MKTRAFLLTAAVIGGFLRAQAAPPAFDVASVKASRLQGQSQFGLNFLPDRFTAANLPLLALIEAAYDLPIMSSRVSGGPAWVRSDGFDIEAKADLPPGLSSKARETRMKLMLQTLLDDRFHLVLRRETKELPVYALVVGKNGPKLQKSKMQEQDCSATAAESCHVLNGGQGRGLHGKAVDMSDVVLLIGNWTDRPLIDMTGLDGLFEIDTEGWAPMRPRMPRGDGSDPTPEEIAAADPARRTLAMVFDRLGLKLEARKGPVEMFTIDRAEKPSAN